jgi:hypothetical protein
MLLRMRLTSRPNLETSAELMGILKCTQKGAINEQLLAERFVVECTWCLGSDLSRGQGRCRHVLADRLQESPHLLRTREAQHPCILCRLLLAWKGFFGASRFGPWVKKFRMENLESDRIEKEMAFDAKQIAPDLHLCGQCDRIEP